MTAYWYITEGLGSAPIKDAETPPPFEKKLTLFFFHVSEPTDQKKISTTPTKRLFSHTHTIMYIDIGKYIYDYVYQLRATLYMPTSNRHGVFALVQ